MPHEPVFRAAIFLSVFILLALAEGLAPFRANFGSRQRRWPGNLGLFVTGILASRVILPAGAVGFAALMERNGTGLFNQGWLPAWLSVMLAITLLDLVIYGQHVIFHKVPFLWRLHRVHHADTEMDVTTGIRFHPVEIILSIGIKLGAIAVLGAPPLAVFLFEVILNASAMFTHANLRLPEQGERLLRLLFVTPGMHRVHHSAERIDTDSNYGFNLSIWDRIFSTYRSKPVPGDEAVVIGLECLREHGEQRLDKLLTQPFRDARPSGKRV